MIMSFFQSLAKIKCRKQCEYVCLNRNDQNFNNTDEYRKYDGDWRNPYRLQYENQRNQAEYDYVPCRDVGEQTNHKCDWLDKYAQEFDGR